MIDYFSFITLSRAVCIRIRRDRWYRILCASPAAKSTGKMLRMLDGWPAIIVSIESHTPEQMCTVISNSVVVGLVLGSGTLD